MKKLLKLSAVILVLLGTSCEVEPVDEDVKNSQLLEQANLSHKKSDAMVKTTADAVNPILGEVTGTSVLRRTKNGLTINYKTDGLIPGHTYTMWWVIFNNPEACATTPCTMDDFMNAGEVQPVLIYGTGHLVGQSGKGNFSSHLKVGDNDGSINELLGLPEVGGILEGNAFSAEVHMIIRSHGPAIPGLINEQISIFTGGCEVDFAPFTEIPDEEGECGDVEVSIHLPVAGS
ncbi:hypothetical protein HC174_02810 [Salinimicrobium sp. CDJ15-81-2]|nr:hypothetical protein [Salinimicrobium nanhaiense]